MLSFLPGPIKGVLNFLLVAINTVVMCSILFVAAFLKLIVPLDGWRKVWSAILIQLATTWITFNNAFMWLTLKMEWKVSGVENLVMDDWYLVLSNHQSWADIPILQRTFNRKIPFLKFFLKQELIWVPFLGIAWWALDFPFMKRYSKEFLEKNPHLKGKDLETTKKACEKFKTIPVSVINFVEGTRFTKAKHEKTKSPYKHLLPPKAAGIAYVLTAMGGQMKSILDVSIVYPGGAGSIWDLFCGRIKEVRVDVKASPITPEIMGDYFGDEAFRAKFQEWLNGEWAEKDARIDKMLA